MLSYIVSYEGTEDNQYRGGLRGMTLENETLHTKPHIFFHFSSSAFYTVLHGWVRVDMGLNKKPYQVLDTEVRVEGFPQRLGLQGKIPEGN